MPVRITLEVQLKADAIEESYAAVRNTLTDTRAFPGNLGVDVLIDEKDPTVVLVLETWATFADHDAYSEYRANVNPAEELKAVLMAAPTTRRFSVREDL